MNALTYHDGTNARLKIFCCSFLIFYRFEKYGWTSHIDSSRRGSVHGHNAFPGSKCRFWRCFLYSYGHTDRQTDRWTDRWTDRGTDRQTDGRTDRRTDGRTGGSKSKIGDLACPSETYFCPHGTFRVPEGPPVGPFPRVPQGTQGTREWDPGMSPFGTSNVPVGLDASLWDLWKYLVGHGPINESLR